MTRIVAPTIGNDAGWDSKRFPESVRAGATQPDMLLRELDREDCKTLKGFTKVFWPVVEPGRPLVEGYALDAIDDHLTAVTRGQIKKLLINVPPGCMKSLKTCVFWTAFEWGPMAMPHLRYICASYNADLTIRDNRRCRMIIDSDRYQQLYGYAPFHGMSKEEIAEQLKKPEHQSRFAIVGDQDAKIKFENTHRGWKIATSVRGGVVGERGDRFIIDDPHNIKTVESLVEREGTLQWFTEIVPSRVNDMKTAVFVVIMQRVHERDVAGLILAKELGYEHLCLPMEWEKDHPHRSSTSIGFVDWREKRYEKMGADAREGELLWPQRFDEDAVDDLKKNLRSWGGTYAEAGQLQQRPAPRGGGMFKRDLWRFYQTGARGFDASRPHGCDASPARVRPAKFDQVIVSVDASFKKTVTGSRVSVLAVGISGPDIFVLDNDTRAMDFKETCDAIAVFDETKRGYSKLCGGMMHKWGASMCLIEDKANGPAIINTLSEKVGGIVSINPEGGKEARAYAMQPTLLGGNILLPEGAAWLEDFIAEFASFPVGMRDDQVDSLSQVVIHLISNQDVARAIAMANL